MTLHAAPLPRIEPGLVDCALLILVAPRRTADDQGSSAPRLSRAFQKSGSSSMARS
jgi:hypothetical protein